MNSKVAIALLVTHTAACGSSDLGRTGKASNLDPDLDASTTDTSSQQREMDSGDTSTAAESVATVTNESFSDSNVADETSAEEVTSADVFTGIGVGVWVPLEGTTESVFLNPVEAPIDDRPPHEPWFPDVPQGESGWKQSAEDLCVPFGAPGLGSTSVWADNRGVTLLRAGKCERQLESGCPSEATGLYFNDGTGWSNLVVTQADPRRPSLVGVLPDGVTVILSIGTMVRIDPSGANSAWNNPLISVASAFLAPDSDLIYTTGLPTLASVNGDEIKGLGQVSHSSGNAIWAGQEKVYLAHAGNEFIEYDIEEETLSEADSVPVGDYAAVWGIEDGAEDEVWLGNTVGQLMHRVDGVWEVISTGLTEPIQRIWGIADVVYFHTSYALGRASSNQAEILVSFPVGYSMSVQALWGTSESEVFVVFHNSDAEEYACGGLVVTWFDGAEFHRF